MDSEQPHQECVKCVVVGDTAVGKTRLICARACNSRLDLTQLMTTHIPTVWAIDQYRIHKEVLERSCEIIDSVNVSLRLWDTFGDHDKDRRFAYGRSDVVLLCFSVANPISLRNCKQIWYPEIRRFCPSTPIVLVGCKNDLRYMYRDEKFLNLCRERSPFFRANHLCSRFPELGRPLRESDILTPAEGRSIAKEMEAPYYETSVLNHYGVNEVFENVIRSALMARKQQRFWMTNLKHIRRPFIQEPFCPPRPNPPKLIKPQTQFEEDMKELFQTQPFTDAILLIGKIGFSTHRIILASVSNAFKRLFTLDLAGNVSESSSLTFSCWGRSASDSSVASSVDTSSGNFNQDTEQLINTSSSKKETENTNLNRANTQRASNKVSRFLSPFSLIDSSNGNNVCSALKRRASCCQISPSPSSKLNSHKTLQHVLFQSITVEHCDNMSINQNRPVSSLQNIVTLSKAITSGALQQCLRFIYLGSIDINLDVPLSEIIDAAEILELDELQRILRNFDNNQIPLKSYCNGNNVNSVLKKRLKYCLNEGLFTDVVFELDDGCCSAHRPILMTRCDMMDAMFRGDFRESSAKTIKFPGVIKETFSQLLYYVYTDEVDVNVMPTSCLHLVELANRLCLPRLVSLIEQKVIFELEKLNEDGVDISEIALKLLEPCQIHNADQLADWCLYYIAVCYNDINHKSGKLLRSLHPENQAYLNRNRWPPVWYLKELEYYERCVRERLWLENPPKGLKRHYNSGCLCGCFSGKSRRKYTKEFRDC